VVEYGDDVERVEVAYQAEVRALPRTE